ncbi:hypothetical protein MES5069_440223 [Mesorhizobium escarrei]|uniref:Lytic murein transglycosylase n=1 Tax=Mesorhizobium escarrei TaxID=666018 RepID=A0ABM9E858_9HYPH|nr:hypothetical protein MES5069_440223 [Mesorhizobium escarrei]
MRGRCRAGQRGDCPSNLSTNHSQTLRQVSGWEWGQVKVGDPSHPLCPGGHLPRKGGDWPSWRLSPNTNAERQGDSMHLP